MITPRIVRNDRSLCSPVVATAQLPKDPRGLIPRSMQTAVMRLETGAKTAER
jgi:hypothetical protein